MSQEGPHSPPTTATSSAKTSEQDWSHVKETITMLYLAVCQIKSSLTDGDHSLNHLTDSFTALANHTREVDKQIQTIDQAAEIATVRQSLTDTASDMQLKIAEAVTAFQFYDRISQRLDHVANGLESMSSLLADPRKLNNPKAWQRIQREVKSSYTMESERLMFEHILRGASVQEALQIYRHHFENEVTLDTNADEDEIELF